MLLPTTANGIASWEGEREGGGGREGGREEGGRGEGGRREGGGEEGREGGRGEGGGREGEGGREGREGRGEGRGRGGRIMEMCLHIASNTLSAHVVTRTQQLRLHHTP